MDGDKLEQFTDISGKARDVLSVGKVEGDLKIETQVSASLFDKTELSALLGVQQLRGVARPRVTDLFEIIRDPAEVPSAIFRHGGGRAIAPYQVPRVEFRQGVEDIQTKLYEELLGSGGGLLVLSRAGLGKTREVADLAIRMCAEGWTICVATAEGDPRMGVS
jgi:hypothetical protein